MQGKGRGPAQSIGVDARGGSGGDKSKIYVGHGRSVYGYGMNPASHTISTSYGYGYGYGYGNCTFGLPLLPMPSLLGSMLYGRGLYGRGKPPVSSTPLGVQGGGILKRHPHGGFVQRRGHACGYTGGHSTGGGRGGGKNLTKEALDADLEEWRLKDKRFAGHSLDAELDEYWSKKDALDSSEAESGK